MTDDLIAIVAFICFLICTLCWGGGGGEGGQGGLNFPIPVPFFSDPCLCVLFLLRNIAQCCEIHFLFLPTPAPLGIPSPALSSPASCTLPAPITPGFPTSFPGLFRFELGRREKTQFKREKPWERGCRVPAPCPPPRCGNVRATKTVRELGRRRRDGRTRSFAASFLC